MLWVLFLFPINSNIGRETKVAQVRKVWEWSGSPLPDSWLLKEGMGAGIGSAGRSFSQRRWAELTYLIDFSTRWKKFSENDRQQLLADPWKFAGFADSVPQASRRQLRNMLVHLLFPEVFER